MPRYRLTIEYDGGPFTGWQSQAGGTSVQDVLERAVNTINGGHSMVYGAGRTDAGVHALGMVAAFRTEKQLPLRAFSDGLNSLLPNDIAIKDAVEAPLAFNPRADAKSKHYRYTIYNGGRRSPLARHRSWHLRGALDLERMQVAAAHFIGEHDFAAFRAANCAAKTTVRRLFSVSVVRDGESVIVDVHGSGFLKNMVRIIAGTLAAVGQGKINPAVVPELFASGDRASAGSTAPPQGLCLMEVFY